jgi:hypothetical protein
MIPERLAKLESMLRNSANIPDATREELLDLVAGLRSEVSSGEPSAPPPGTTETMSALSSSVQKLEGTHPHLVEMVNQLALTLSHMGI